MFKAPKHQVAGHQAASGQLGPLVDGTGRFFKPLQSDDRGSRELAFYYSFSSNKIVPDHIRTYFPVFYGTQIVESSDGSGLLPHLVLEDVVSSWPRPCIMDVKIGSRTWYPEASDEYIQRSLIKDRETSSLALGFRISGLQIYGTGDCDPWKPGRKSVQTLGRDGVRQTLRKFVSSVACSGTEVKPDCSFASCVFGGSVGILAQLLDLKSWFEDQTQYSFNSCSVLMAYDKESVEKGECSDAKVKLIDFAHVVDGKGVIDHNFLGGLCSLIKFVSEVLTNTGDLPEKNVDIRSDAEEDGAYEVHGNDRHD